MTPETPDQVLLKVVDLVKHFPVTRGLFGKTVGKVQAVSGVSFEIRAGETLGLVGESGCGKTTVGRSILRLIEPTSGDVWFEGKNIARLSQGELRPLRQEIQLIFQDPFSSLNPRMRVVDIVGEALVSHGLATEASVEAHVAELLAKVGIPPNWLHRYPHEFSGGQRQRIGIARALALRPKLIVCDEAVSALDVSIQAQVLNLLMDLKEEFGLSYLFIAHDLSVVRHISDRVGVMYLGEIVELAGRDTLFSTPAHPYTQALLSAIPIPDPFQKRQRVVLAGDVPTPLNPPSGCRFHTRCPAALPRCSTDEPPLVTLKSGDGPRLVRCVHAENLPEEDWHPTLQKRIDEAVAAKESEPKPHLPLRPLRSHRVARDSSPSSDESTNPRTLSWGNQARAILVAGAVGAVALFAFGHWFSGALAVTALFVFARELFPRERRRFLLGALSIVAVGMLVSLPVGIRQRRAATESQLEALDFHIKEFSRAYGRPPAALSELGFRLFEVFPDGVPADPWGNRIEFSPNDETGRYTLKSLGADGTTSDDDLVRPR